ncbi:MAG: radical SAM protein [Proteobacteria bacterium]|nr:radical SAM protein [Pseudomonadota bacterium]
MTNATNPSLTRSACAKGGSIYLPVAAKTNVRRRFGEPETPGRALSPRDVCQWLDRVLADTTDGGVKLSTVGINGPGDPLADPATTLETLRAVRAAHPELALSLTTIGLCPQDTTIAELAGQLAAAGVSQVTLLVDAVDPVIVEKLFAWIRPGKRTLPLPEACRMLVDSQAQAIRFFREAGLFVKVNMTVYAGINEDHVPDVASIVASLGADMLAVLPFTPAAPVLAASSCGCDSVPCTPVKCSSCATSSSCGSKPAELPDALAEELETPALPPLAPERLAELRATAARIIALVPEADPCGQDITWVENAGAAAVLDLQNPALPKPAPGRPNVAVASSGGLEVDLHLGQAIRFLIYGPRERDGLPSLLCTRDAPEPVATGSGTGDARWNALADTLSDCFAILASSVGQNPRKVLSERGITVMTTEADVQSAVDALFGGGKKNGKKRVKAD